jgi:hypothetical protein
MKEMILQSNNPADKTYGSLNISDNVSGKNDGDDSYKYSPDNTYSFNNSYNAGSLAPNLNLCQSFGENNCFI